MAFKFLKTGADSAAIAAQHQAEVEQRKEQGFKAFRFWLNAGEENVRITFVDGELNEEGFLLPPRWYEHNLKLNGEWGNHYVCPEKTNPEAHDKCPICEAKEFYSALVTGFTIIDHRSWTIKTGKNQGKVIANTRKFLVAQSRDFELLNKIAIKRGGLAGCTFEVSRLDSKSSRIGSMFDFVEKRSIPELQQMYQQEIVDPKTGAKSVSTLFLPLDYEKELIYKSGDELRKMGLGKVTNPSNQHGSGFQGGASMPPPAAAPANVDYSQQL